MKLHQQNLNMDNKMFDQHGKPATTYEAHFDKIDIEDNKPKIPFEDCFHVGMGTEMLAPLLYSLVRFVRPVRLMEIGLGYTTPWLLKGIEDNESVDLSGNSDLDYFKKTYDPVLICIDDMSDKESTASQSAMKYKDSKYIDLIESTFQGKSKEIADKYGKLDFVWFDCGGHVEYGQFLEEYLPICSGHVFLHYTYYRGKPNPNHVQIEKYVDPKEWERLDLIEPHKYRQGSVTMLKRRIDYDDS